MEALLEEHGKLVKRGSLSKIVEDVQITIDLLVKARDSIANSVTSFLLFLFPYYLVKDMD
jgi:hypothetical protein